MKRIKATFEVLNDICFIIQVAAVLSTTAISSTGDLWELVVQTV